MIHYHLRELQLDDLVAIERVALGMRATLVEVLGQERGESMYTIEWLIDRVRQHLDRVTYTSAVFAAFDSEGDQVGHTIVRLDQDFDGSDIGLFSTTYVVPEHRGKGLAQSLVSRGESWMLENGINTALTYTEPGNAPLIRLFERAGFRWRETRDSFAVLSKTVVTKQTESP